MSFQSTEEDRKIFTDSSAESAIPSQILTQPAQFSCPSDDIRQSVPSIHQSATELKLPIHQNLQNMTPRTTAGTAPKSLYRQSHTVSADDAGNTLTNHEKHDVSDDGTISTVSVNHSDLSEGPSAQSNDDITPLIPASDHTDIRAIGKK